MSDDEIAAVAHAMQRKWNRELADLSTCWPDLAKVAIQTLDQHRREPLEYYKAVTEQDG